MFCTKSNTKNTQKTQKTVLIMSIFLLMHTVEKLRN